MIYEKTLPFHLDRMSRLPFKILWVAGNHENYDMIEEYNLEEWQEGKVRYILRDKIIYLERGQIFKIEGKNFFTFGGASSHDVQGRILDRDDPEFARKKQSFYAEEETDTRRTSLQNALRKQKSVYSISIGFVVIIISTPESIKSILYYTKRLSRRKRI